MNLSQPETWRLLWVAAGAMFLAAEVARRLRLWFLPFAVGAAVAAAAAWLGLSVALEWAAFVAVSMAALPAMRPLARRLAAQSPLAKIGSSRWIGREALVEAAIPAVGEGWVRLGRERWRAESGMALGGEGGATLGAVPAGSTVLVTGVSGTHLIVLPLDVVELAPISELNQRTRELYQRTTSGHLPDQGA